MTELPEDLQRLTPGVNCKITFTLNAFGEVR